MKELFLEVCATKLPFDKEVLRRSLESLGYDVKTSKALESPKFRGFAEDAPVCIVADLLFIYSLVERWHLCSDFPRLLVPVVNAEAWEHLKKDKEIALLKERGYVIVDFFCDERLHETRALPSLAFEINAAIESSNKFLFGYIPQGDHPGAFGVRRRHHYHTGVDLYVHRDNAFVYPFEDGEIVDYGHFTGTFCNSPWWNNTHYIAVKHGKHVVVYGEVLLDNSFISKDGVISDKHIGDKVTASTRLGVVIAVTKNRHPEYHYHNNKMLHVELYQASKFRGAAVDEWELDKKQPGALLDPTDYIKSKI